MDDQRDNSKKKIAIVTATRAEYGILKPLIRKVEQDNDFEMTLLVTGTHLAPKYGHTKDEIIKDQIPIAECIPILEGGNEAYDVSVTMANAIKGFAWYFHDKHPDIVIILGDRTEMLGVCCAAMNEKIPIAHLHGGELTEGAIDDCVRHAITKMSFLHFPATEEYRKRIIQMGESPDRVYNVGALGVENILTVPLLNRTEVCCQLGIPVEQPYVVVTFHPATLDDSTVQSQVNAVIQAMSTNSQFYYLITKANADVGGSIVNLVFEEYVNRVNNAQLVSSLGMVKYLSAVKHCVFVMGNSSSGIIEAPALGTPTVNIGDRQQGRIMSASIINCSPEYSDIDLAMQKAVQMEHVCSFVYGDGNTSEKILAVIKKYLSHNTLGLKKKFYDLSAEKI